MPTVDDLAIARKLWQDAKALAPGVAKIRGRGNNQKEATPEEELLLWNTVAKGWTVEKEMQMLAEGKSPEAIGIEKFPHRMKLLESGDRALSKYEQFKYGAKLAQKADPTWQPRTTKAQEPAFPTPQPAAPPPLPEPLPPPDPPADLLTVAPPPAPLPTDTAGAFPLPLLGG